MGFLVPLLMVAGVGAAGLKAGKEERKQFLAMDRALRAKDSLDMSRSGPRAASSGSDNEATAALAEETRRAAELRRNAQKNRPTLLGYEDISSNTQINNLLGS